MAGVLGGFIPAGVLLVIWVGELAWKRWKGAP